MVDQMCRIRNLASLYAIMKLAMMNACSCILAIIYQMSEGKFVCMCFVVSKAVPRHHIIGGNFLVTCTSINMHML